MGDVERLAGVVKSLEDSLARCVRCGMCRSVCPLFAATGREIDSARGKLALLDGLLKEAFRSPDKVDEHLNRCLLCGSCAVHCPSGVKVLDVFLEARMALARCRGLSPLKKVIFRGMLARPELFDRVTECAARAQGLFGARGEESREKSDCVSPAFSMLGLPPLAASSLHKRISRFSTEPGVLVSETRVAFFPGCLIDKSLPGIGEATLRSLKHHGVEAVIPDALGCCGIPAAASGDGETFDALVRRNLEMLSAAPFDYVITACATCAFTMRKLWPALAKGLSAAEKARAVEIAGRTVDISEFLVNRGFIAGPPQHGRNHGTEIIATYHDPCHLKKSLGISSEPRRLIAASASHILREMEDADACCGCGGSFAFQHPELAAAAGERKRTNIAQTGCSVVATSCPACILHISNMLSRAGDRIQVRHVIEIYAETLRD